MKKLSLLLLLTVLSSYSMAQNITNNKFGNGFLNVIAKDSSWSMKLGLRVQSLYEGTWNINDTSGIGNASSTFLIRRARLKFGGFIFTPKLQYKIELGLSNRDIGKVDARNNSAPNIILDAVLKWNFYKNFTLWAGQTKLPGNRERVISSANLQLVDRSLLNSLFNVDRDMGFQLHHHFKIGKEFIIKEAFALSQGEGRNVVQDNIGGFEYTSRIEFLPFGNFTSKGDYFGGDLKREKKPKLAIGISYDYNDRAVKNRSNQGSYMIDNSGINDDGYFHSNISTVFADMMFKFKGFSFMAEYAMRSSDVVNFQTVNPDLTLSKATVTNGSGMNLQVGYLFKNNWEVAGRFTQIVPSKVGSDQYEQYTFGVSKYIVGHKLKVQTDLSYLKTNHSPDAELMYRLQFEFHF